MRTDGRCPRRRATRSACRPAQTTTASRRRPRRASSRARPPHHRSRPPMTSVPGSSRAPPSRSRRTSTAHTARKSMIPVSATCSAARAATCGSRARASAADSRVTASPLARPRSWRAARAASSDSSVATTSLPVTRCGTPSAAGEVEQRLRPGAAPARLEAAGRVVQPGVDDAAVATGLVPRPVVLLLEDGHLRRRVLTQHALGDGEPDDPAADDGDAAGAGHGIRRVSPRRPRGAPR